jgi:hypothetical protein
MTLLAPALDKPGFADLRQQFTALYQGTTEPTDQLSQLPDGQSRPRKRGTLHLSNCAKKTNLKVLD